jgi:hypothetical protein
VIPNNLATLTTTSIPTATTQLPTDDGTSITQEESKQVADEQSTLTQQPSTTDAAELYLYFSSIHHWGGITITIKRRYHVKHLYYRR